jgi:hypothetical protein
MRKYILILACLIKFSSVQAQSENDLLVVMHQETLNKLLSAIGEIAGNAEYKVLGITGHYTWKLNSTQMNLLKDSAFFSTDVTVETGFNTYTDHINGKMSITYDKKTNLISVKVADAVFELRVSVLGKEFKIKSVQIADYLSSPFTFEGPQTVKNEMNFTMPNGELKKVTVRPSSLSMRIVEKQIIVASELYFKLLEQAKR